MGLTVKAYCGDNEGNGWMVELTAAGYRKLKGKGSSQRCDSPLRSAGFVF